MLKIKFLIVSCLYFSLTWSQLQLSVTNSICNGGSTGVLGLILTSTAGNGTYIFQITGPNGTYNSPPTTQLTYYYLNLPSGNYTASVYSQGQVIDSVNCTIGQPPALILSTVANHVSCFGGQDGSVNLTVSGGTPPYSYLWNNNDTLEDTQGLVADTAMVTVTDTNGCIANKIILITQPSALVVQTFINGGNINATASGGTPPYVFQWSNGTSNQNLNNVTMGTYTVTVTDSNSCSQVDSATITDAALFEGDFNAIVTFPNPAFEDINIWVAPAYLNQTYVVIDGKNRTVLSGTLLELKTQVNLLGLSSGVYFIRVGNYHKRMVKYE